MKQAGCMRTALLAVLMIGFAQGVLARNAPDAKPQQDPRLLRFVERALAWYPESVFTITEDSVEHTPSGSYRMVSVKRDCDNRILAATTTFVIDEVARVAWHGSVGRLQPEGQSALAPDRLRGFVEGFLPRALAQNMRLKSRVVWDSEAVRAGALIPFTLMIDTGYGEYPKATAVTSDGKFVVLGTPIPFDKDPVAFRREVLRSDGLVVWDYSSKSSQVEIVEFSDFECPGCKAKWPVIAKALETFGTSVRHGMVGYPLTTIHPWAFRAAASSWCVAVQDPQLLIPLKEVFYSMQKEMEVSLVTPTSVDFVQGHGMDEKAFIDCYLREPSLDAVHGQLGLGNRIGVAATPTYFVNGWKIQMPREDWLLPMIERLLADEEP